MILPLTDAIMCGIMGFYTLIQGVCIMELAIIHKGQVFQVEEKLEEYDLSKPFARAEVMESIQFEIRRIQQHEG